MPLKVKCPEGHELTVPKQRAGSHVRCPICMQTVQIPEDSPTKPSTTRKKDKTKSDKKPKRQVKPNESADEPKKRDPKKIKPSREASSTQRKSAKPARVSQEKQAKEKPSIEQRKSTAPARTEAESKSRKSKLPAREVTAPPKTSDKRRPEAIRVTEQELGDSDNGDLHQQPVSDLASSESIDRSQVAGVEYDPSKRWTAYYLGASLALIGLLSIGPAIFEFVNSQNPVAPRPIERWAYAALFIGGVQLFYAIYLVQLPDWSSVWVIAVLALLIATVYAMLLGVVWFGKDDSQIINLLGLPQHLRDEARLWCFTMLSANGLLAYFSGREAVRWHKIYTIQNAA